MNDKKQKVMAAARAVFLKYGYKRVTMNDIAETARISRPALYLIFSNKEEILKAVSQDVYVKSLAELTAGLSDISSPVKQLEYAFEIWTVRPFTFIMSSPEAKDLIDCCHATSKEIYEEVGATFEMHLMAILKPLMKSNAHNSATVARILRHAARGFKEYAQDSQKSSEELRKMIKDFLDMMLISLSAI